MPINDDERNLIGQMTGTLRTEGRERERLNAYFEGSARYTTLGFAVPEGLEDLLTLVNMTKIVAESIEERIDVEGFRLPPARKADGSFEEIDPEQADTDMEMWDWWQANELDSESQLGHLDYIVSGSFFTCVGTNPDDPETPKISVESPDEMTCLFQPDGRTPRAAFRLYDSEPEFSRKDRATLYLPDSTLYLKRGKGSGGWVYDEDDAPGRDDHDFGEVLATPFLNNARSRKRVGRSELHDAITLQDAAVRNLTNLQVGQETTALPQRGVIGAAANDLKNADGTPVTDWDAYFGAVWTLANEKASTFQFSAADLRNFHETTMHYARLISMTYGLPPYYMGAGNDNGPGADSVRATEARLIMRVRRKIRALSAGWERTMRLSKKLISEGEVDPRYNSLEVLFRNPETPTQAQIVDGVVKLHAEGLLSVKDALEEVGFSAIRRERILANIAAEADEKAAREREASIAMADAMTGFAGEPAAPQDKPGVSGFDPASRV